MVLRWEYHLMPWIFMSANHQHPFLIYKALSSITYNLKSSTLIILWPHRLYGNYKNIWTGTFWHWNYFLLNIVLLVLNDDNLPHCALMPEKMCVNKQWGIDSLTHSPYKMGNLRFYLQLFVRKKRYGVSSHLSVIQTFYCSLTKLLSGGLSLIYSFYF